MSKIWRDDRHRKSPASKVDVSALVARVSPAQLIGKEFARFRRTGDEWRGGCPMHGGRDPNFSINDSLRWCCHSVCGGGDAIDFIARRDGLDKRRDFRRITETLAELAGVDVPKTSAPLLRAPRRYVRPPDAEVSRVASECLPVTVRPRWIERLGGVARPGIDVAQVAAFDLARILPCPDGWPAWVSRNHPIAIPLYDSSGDLRSLKFRRHDGCGRKEHSPSGFDVARLVFACPLAVRMLRREPVDVRTVVIVEGAPGFLAWASRFGGTDVATIGIFSGAWCDDFARSIPDGVVVFVDTDNDEAGDKYASAVIRSLARRHVDGRIRLVLADRDASADETEGGPQLRWVELPEVAA